MNKILNNLKIDLENIYKEKLISIILYGSAATYGFNPKTSDINLIVIIENLTAQDLKTGHSTIKKWIKTQNPAPLFIDSKEWLNSTDVYALEYSDIKERYKIIYGENLVSELNIDKKDLRLQCESEIKHILVKLRQAYLLNCKDKDIIKLLIKNSSKSIIAIFRAILRLLNEDVPHEHEEVVKKLSEKMEFDHNIFLDILLFRENKKKFNSKELENVIQKLIDSLDQMLGYIDKFEI